MSALAVGLNGFKDEERYGSTIQFRPWWGRHLPRGGGEEGEEERKGVDKRSRRGVNKRKRGEEEGMRGGEEGVRGGEERRRGG
ncbi:hypothetical protein NHX12_025660 [Muraenolepis orangiensis]|uniref:Uncharacterized protein n=1 Tax=Muraenolepis orangiensis TaxID=630683 RepID=A0A9Q0EF13_9TELE|nr:hypothetical protein NHX12_025660 [Muraenolepis orangiensis]